MASEYAKDPVMASVTDIVTWQGVANRTLFSAADTSLFQVSLFCTKFRQKFELKLLYLHKTAPLVRKKMINFFMKMPDLKLRFEVYLIVML